MASGVDAEPQEGSDQPKRHLTALGDPEAPAAPAPAGPGKRGRRQRLVDPGGGPVAGLAHALATCKLSAGDPSYDDMRRRFGAQASKSALSAAARGVDLPSWETTWEFVRCLAPEGSDPDELRDVWRRRWETARDATGPAAAPVVPGRPRWRARVIAVAVPVAAAGVLGWLVARDGHGLPGPPLPGDASAFVADVTVPDGAEMAPGETFLKVWEIRNTGRVAWEGRFFQRQPDSQGDCRSVGRFPVPDTQPGEPVRVSVTVLSPSVPGGCKVYWKMVDDQGRMFFPGRRPVYFDVVVPG